MQSTQPCGWKPMISNQDVQQGFSWLLPIPIHWITDWLDLLLVTSNACWKIPRIHVFLVKTEPFCPLVKKLTVSVEIPLLLLNWCQSNSCWSIHEHVVGVVAPLLSTFTVYFCWNTAPNFEKNLLHIQPQTWEFNL